MTDTNRPYSYSISQLQLHCMDETLTVLQNITKEIKFLQTASEIHLKLTRTESIQLIEEYGKFLLLKIITKDYDHIKLSPSIQINKIWHLHLLYPKHYYLFCKNQTNGKIINHSPDAKYDGKDKKRLRDTLRIYHTIFGDPPSNIWR